MKGIKDFFYDKNDIIIVLLIIAAAAFVIYNRVDAIMAYPQTIANESSASQTKTVERETNDANAAADEATEAEAGESNTTVHITVEDGDTSISVSQKLAEAGLVSSAEEFESYVSNMDKSGSIKSGTFEIPSGSTDEEILNIITQ